MKRREQIEAEEKSLMLAGEYIGFIEGAEWADLNPDANHAECFRQLGEANERLKVAIEYLEFISLQSCCETCATCLACEAESALRKIVPSDPLGIKHTPKGEL